MPWVIGIWKAFSFSQLRRQRSPGLGAHLHLLCMYSSACWDFQGPWAQFCKGHSLTSSDLILSLPPALGTFLCLVFAYMGMLVWRAFNTAETHVCCQIPNHVYSWGLYPQLTSLQGSYLEPQGSRLFWLSDHPFLCFPGASYGTWDSFCFLSTI